MQPPEFRQGIPCQPLVETGQSHDSSLTTGTHADSFLVALCWPEDSSHGNEPGQELASREATPRKKLVTSGLELRSAASSDPEDTVVFS